MAGITALWVLQPIIHDPLDSDFTLVLIAVRIGLEHGWNQIYSLNLQHQLFTEMRPGVVFNDGQRYLAPPPLAWLTVPFTVFGQAGALYAWLLVSVAALIAAWRLAAPGDGPIRWLWLLGAISWYPVLYGLAYGQPALLVLASAMACWWLAEHRRPYLAGFALALGMSVKPQLLLAVPLVLLLTRRWRVLVGWFATIAPLAIASMLVLGWSGLEAYRSLLAEAQGVVNNRYFTLAYVLGPGAPSYVAQLVVLLATAIAAYINRRANAARLIALGMVASAFGATYWHLQDFTILAGAAWLFWRDGPPAWQKAWVAVVALCAELAWPLTPLPLLIATAVWLVLLAVPGRTASVQAAAPASA